MNEQLHTLFMNIMNTFLAFVPSFLVGIILIIIGWVTCLVCQTHDHPDAHTPEI